MMRRRASVTLLAGVLLAGLVAVPGSPAGAQNGGSMLDLPRLGFEVDPKAGNVGDSVAAQVNPADVQEHCYATVEEMRAAFGRWGTAISTEPSETKPDLPQTQYQAIVQDMYDLWIPDDWEAVMNATYGPTWPFIQPLPPAAQYPVWFGSGATQEWWFYRVLLWTSSQRMLQPFEKTPEQYVAINLPRMIEFGLTAGNAPLLFDQSFVLTFVDPVSQEMVGDMGNFDPNTGVGEISVPDLDPGLWAVAGACIEPNITPESVANAIDAAMETYAEWDMFPEGSAAGGDPAFCVEPRGAGLDACETFWVEIVLATIVPELVAPRALGIDFYCVLNEDGFCATPPDAVGLLAELSEEELAEFADLEADDGAGDGDGGPDGLTVEPVSASPAFTG